MSTVISSAGHRIPHLAAPANGFLGFFWCFLFVCLFLDVDVLHGRPPRAPHAQRAGATAAGPPFFLVIPAAQISRVMTVLPGMPDGLAEVHARV